MTPEELKKLALEATKKEYDQIIERLQEAAKNGAFYYDVENLTDGAEAQLLQNGFSVEYLDSYIIGKEVFRISFK